MKKERNEKMMKRLSLIFIVRKIKRFLESFDIIYIYLSLALVKQRL